MIYLAARRWLRPVTSYRPVAAWRRERPNEMVDLAAIESLLQNFPRARIDLGACCRLLYESRQHVVRLHRESLARRAHEAPEFNVFRVTERHGYEVTTHSAFLAYLFDPLGRHEQGNLFLSAFLQRLKEKLPDWRAPSPDHRWRVKPESDRIDVLLAHPEGPILLENKWSARDQRDQLFRYWNLHHRNTRWQHRRIPAVYLTRCGHGPDLSEDARRCRRFMDDLIRLSYREDIRAILAGAVPQIGSVRIREAVEQYLELMPETDNEA